MTRPVADHEMTATAIRLRTRVDLLAFTSHHMVSGNTFARIPPEVSISAINIKFVSLNFKKNVMDMFNCMEANFFRTVHLNRFSFLKNLILMTSDAHSEFIGHLSCKTSQSYFK